MSENSDFAGGNPYAGGGNQNLASSQSWFTPHLSNKLIFIGFFISTVFGFSSIVLVAMAPNLISTHIIVWGNIALTSMAATLVFVLYQRAGAKTNALGHTDAIEPATGRNSAIAAMQAQIAELEAEKKELRRAYQEAQIRAEDARKSKAAFLAHLNHDIRTPLNHIIGFADLVSHQAFGPLGDKRYLDYVRDIKKSGEGLLNSVSDVLELAQLENGQRILASEEILVDDLLGGLKKRFEGRAKRCSVSLEVTCFCAAVLYGDRMGYERLLQNLLDNAFKFTPAGGKIRLAAWVADDGVVLEVTDTGIGIPKNRLGKLLQPFSKKDPLEAQEYRGMGLGLAIARSVAELSGGELVIESTPSIGTTVAVSLPLAPHLQPEQDQAA
ncbi:MAG TPA: HAMP domain-containing histidine kinase [Devosia sp.]|nr:HAMP domain-containing histidine kinase [Devosia sp.]